MNRILFLISFLFLVTCWVDAQSPQKICYQAVVRNESGILVSNKNIRLHIRIINDMTPPLSLFDETRTVTTDAHGFFSIEIGDQSSIANIDWSGSDYFILADVASEGGNKYNLHTKQQLMSVPYALYAHIADTLLGTDLREKQVISRVGDTLFLTGGSFVKLPQLFDGDYRNLENLPTSNLSFANDAGYLTQEVQQIWISHDTLFLTGGSFVKIPAGFDGNYNHLTNRPNIPTLISSLTNDLGFINHEVQVLSISNDTIFLTGGSFVKLPHYTEVQGLSDVTAINDSAFSQLKDVLDPTDPQDAVTKYYLDSVLSVWNSDTVDRSTHNTFVVNACDNYTWYGNTYSIPGTYTHSYSNEGGYFSVDTLFLTIRVGTYNVDNVTAQGSYTWHDTLYTSSGDYLYHYNNLYGCPSVDTLHLTIVAGGGSTCTAYRMQGDTLTINACNRVIWYGQDIRSSGVYEHSLGTIGYRGCDSVVRVNVIIRAGFQQDTAVRGATMVNWRGGVYTTQGDYGDTLTSVNGCDSIYVLHFMVGGTAGIGAAPGLYSVGIGNQVRFASGNLQYQSSTNYWQFAKHQYDLTAITCMAPYYPSWADMFGWATSGYHNASDTLNQHYKPWAQSNTSAVQGSYEYINNQYGYGPSETMADTNLTGTSENYDWGMYNPIINGGNGAGLWHLLSQQQWNYLLNQRPNASNLRSFASIHNVPTSSGNTANVCGYIILSDAWTSPAGITFVPNATDLYTNSYSLEEWDSIEAHGAVFLPLTGDHPGNLNGSYWTNTSGGSGAAYALNMSGGSFILAPYNRSNPYCIRLAQDYVSGVPECTCTYYDTNIICNNSFTWHGYSYNASGDYMEAIVNNAGCDSIITLSLMINEPGVLNGSFSVGVNRHVKFSKANLQYKPSAHIWRFGIHQYDYVGAQNKYLAPQYTGWIDLIGWGVSGYHDSTDVFNLNDDPAILRGDRTNYGPSINMSDWDLYNTGAHYDWGVHNAIANGGNTPGQWRTLSRNEWEYLLFDRPNAANLVGFATLHGVRGIVLLPDNWSTPSGQVFFPVSNEAWQDRFEDNVYDLTDWAVMEAAGAVFLPAAGYRNGFTIEDATYNGQYWSVTCSTYDDVWGTPSGQVSDESAVWTSRSWHMLFYLLPRGGKRQPSVSDCGWDGWVTQGDKHLGCSVRLVKDF